MAYEIRDFDDIIDMVMEEMKYQSDDTTAIARIKRDINAIYLDEVVPTKRWNWLQGHTKVQHKAYYNAGTCTVTPESTTVTLSVAPAVATGSRAGYLFSVDGFDEIYTIASHTAGSTTITLSSQYNGSASSTATFKIWADTIALPTNCKETIEVWQDFYRSTMEALGPQEFRRRARETPKLASKPQYYSTWDYELPSGVSTEVEATRYRVMKVHPSMVSDTITLHVDYLKEASPLDLDADEPLMPYEDRIVLVYGALSRAWARERNPEEAARNRMLFEAKLARMAGKVEDGFDKPQLTPDSMYVRKKRGPRPGARFRHTDVSGGSSSYTSPTYITNAEIATGNTLSGNLTVNSGVTIDGVDISVLSSEVDALQALSSGQIFVGNSSNVSTAVTPTGDVTISNTGVTSIGTGVIVNADISSSAAIARSKFANGTADHVLINDASGVMSSEAALSPVRGGTGVANNAAATLTRSGNHALTITTTGTTNVTLPTSGTLITGTGASTDNAIVRNDGTGGAIQTSTVTIGDTGAIVNTLAADVVPLKITQFSGGAEDLLQIFFSNGTDNAFEVTAGGRANSNLGFFTNAGAGFNNDSFTSFHGSQVNWGNGSTTPAWSFLGSSGSTDFQAIIQATVNKAGNRGLVVKGVGSQTANLSEHRDSSDNVLNYVAANGRIQADSGLGAKRTATATDYTATIADYFVAVTSTAAARTITLPAANTFKAGQMLVIADESGAAGTNNITVSRAGADTIDGTTSVTISVNYGVLRLYSDGTSLWKSW